MAAIPKITVLNRQSKKATTPGGASLIAGFVTPAEFNEVVDRLNSITTENGELNVAIEITGALTGDLIFEGATADDYELTVHPADIAQDSTYTIPDVGATANFVMTAGAQTIAGAKTFSDPITQNDTTNQIVLGATRTATISAPTPAGASRVYTMPDPGADASFVMTESAQTINGQKTFGSPIIYKALESQTALAGGAQAGTALSAEYMNFTTVATALDSAQLPTPALGTKRIVRNSSTKPMAVFGQTGATIDDGAANASIVVAPNSTVIFDAVSATAWKSSIGTTKVSEVITEEITLTATEIVGTSAGDLGHASGAVLVAGVSSAYAMEFVSAVAIYDFDTAAYTGGGNDTTINIGSGGAVLTGVINSADLIGAAGDKIVMLTPLSTAAIPLSVGTGLSMNSVTAWTQPGTAAGVLRVQVSYRLHKTGL